MSIFNWYILGDDILCGDLCLVTMRQDEYISEKNTYKSPEYIQKRDQKWRKKHPLAYRFHEFIQVPIKHVCDNIVTVVYSDQEQQVILQNIDGFFYFNESRKKKQEEKIKDLRRCVRT